MAQLVDEIDYESLPAQEKLYVHLAAGAAAGIMEHCAMFPIDTVKTRMQSLDKTAPYKGVRQTFRMLLTEAGGFRVTLRGFTAVFLGAGPAHAAYFSVYEYFKNAFGGNANDGLHHPIASGSAGVLATLVHDGVMNPFDVVKQRMQMYKSPYVSVMDCLRTTLRSEGLWAFYRSYPTQLSMNIPFQTVHFVTYEYLQRTLNPQGHYSPMTHIIAGGGAGAFAAAVTTPMDVAKTLLNTQERSVISQAHRVDSMTDAVRYIKLNHGPRGFFKGLSARVIFQTPSTAICWSVYEFFKHAFSHDS